MNTPVAEREPNITISFTPEKIDLLQILSVQLSEIHNDRIDQETPIPEEIALEIEATLDEKEEVSSAGEVDIEEETAKPKSQNSDEDKQRERVFLRIGSDNIDQAIVVRDSATVGKNFHTSEECTIGKNSVIGDHCSIASPIGRRVHIGNDVEILEGCTVGAINLKKWGYSRPLKDDAGNIVKDEDGETVKEWVEYKTHIGNRVYMSKGSKIRPYSTIGDDVTIGAGAEIGKSVTKAKKDGHLVESQKVPTKPTSIGNGCTVGTGTVVESGAQIGSGYWIADGVTVPGTVKLPDNDTGKEIIIDSKFLDKYLFNQRKAEREKAKV